MPKSIRWSLVAVPFALILWLAFSLQTPGFKRPSIPPMLILGCLASSGFAAFLCRAWRTEVAPLVAGVIGGTTMILERDPNLLFAGSAVQYGAIFGVLVGLCVVLIFWRTPNRSLGIDPR